MNPPDIVRAVTPVVEALDTQNVPYLVGGSVASSVLGIARATLDVDLVADLRQAHVQGFVQRLENTYYVDGEMITDAILRRSSFNVIHLDTMLKVDVFVLKDTEYDRQAFQRRLRDTLEDTDDARAFYLASAEDTILNKLDWYRMGDEVSDRQWGDVLGVLKVQAELLDIEYLTHWGHKLGLTTLLERAMGEAWGGVQPVPVDPPPK